MNKRVYAVVCVLLIGLFLLPAASVSAGGNVGPRAMLYAYYSAINGRDYGMAYAQWLDPIQTYENFVAGYSTTTRVDAYFGGFQPNGISSMEGGVPTVLIGYHADGSRVAFNGCYNVVYNETGTGAAQWMISGALIFPLDFVPDGSSIEQFLTTLCYPRSGFGVYDIVQHLLIDYYDAVNRADYLTAYNLWFTPNQTYENFAAGYADTSEVAFFYGDAQFNGQFRPLNEARVPVVLFGYHTDGSMVAYQGCYILGFSEELINGWRIAGASLQPMTFITATPDDTTIQQALAAPCY